MSGARDIIKEVFIAAPPAVVWDAISTAEGLAQWFPAEAQVEPGVGGSIWLSWGEGAEGRTPIVGWEPLRHLAWAETYGDVRFAVEIQLAERAGGTLLRLVHSGFGSGEDWDEQYHMIDGGWTYFLANLRHWLERHRGLRRTLIRFREVAAAPRAVVWPRMLDALDPSGALAAARTGDAFRGGHGLAGTILLAQPPYQLGATIDTVNDGLFLLELEGAPEGCRPALWVSLYGVDAATIEDVRARLGTVYTQALAGLGAPPP